MKKYNCNDTLDYAHEFHRMCKTFRSSRGQKLCKGCPLAKKPCDIYDITSEHVKLVQAWSDAHPETVLTDEQREIFKVLDLLGLKFIVQDSDGAVYAFAERPRKWCTTWVGEGDYLKLKSKYHKTGVFDAISPLVSWDDKEPLNIAEVLKNNQ